MSGYASFTEKQQALVATALAYFHQGKNVQYDGRKMMLTERTEGGTCRQTSDRPPEAAARDEYRYTVCSDFCYSVYHDALGWELGGSSRDNATGDLSDLPVTDPMVICKYAGADGMTDQTAALEMARSILQPGDLVVGSGKDAGHIMLCLGDYKDDGQCWFAHSWGKSYDLVTGMDKFEENGSIIVEPADGLLFTSGSGRWDLTNPKKGERFAVLRPFNDPAMDRFSITPAARCRMTWYGLSITRYAELSHYRSLFHGQRLAVTMEMTNHSREDFAAVPVSTPLPEGAELLRADGTADATGITAFADIPAGQTVYVTAAFRVTAKRGEEVLFPTATAAGLPTRELRFSVSGQKPAAAAFDHVTERDWSGCTQGAFANRFYREFLGVELDLPETILEMQDALLELTDVAVAGKPSDGRLWTIRQRVDEPYRRLRGMILREHITGFGVYTEPHPEEAPRYLPTQNRVRTYLEMHYEPGDIFLGFAEPDIIRLTNTKNAVAYIYLGGGRVAVSDGKGALRIDTWENTLQRSYRLSLLLALRPSLVQDIK